MTAAHRGEVWEFSAGSHRFRGLIITSDEYNDVATPWAIIIAPHTSAENVGYTVALRADDPGWPGLVVLPVVHRVGSPTRCLGYLSHETYGEVERGLRELLELP